MKPEQNSIQRVLTTIGFVEPDRVPLFLFCTMHGAKELGLSIKDYYSSGKNVIEGQIRLREKYHSDCFYPFFYAAVEIEAYGGDVIYRTDGPPNAGRPIIRNAADIHELQVPTIENSPSLVKVINAIKGLSAYAKGTIPIIGVIMSPFSLPVMQMGFEAYLDLLYDQPELFWLLMEKNEEFSVAWANAQLDAGATAICYFDPVSSPTCIPPDLYRKTGCIVAKRTISQIHGPTATHLASGLTLPIIQDLISTGTLILGVSTDEDIGEIKRVAHNGLRVLGNLNGIEMRNWTPEDAESAVKEAIRKAGPGGGFILSDNHGEIPWQVPDSVLTAISNSVRKWGEYPLTWINS